MQPELTPSVPLTPLTYARRAEPAELPELMDSPCGYQEFHSFLRDLIKVNRLHSRLSAHTRLPRSHNCPHRRSIATTRTSLSRILDVGSGGGDTLRAVARWAAQRNLTVELTGIDLNPHSTRAAGELSAEDPLALNIHFLTADVFSYSPDFPARRRPQCAVHASPQLRRARALSPLDGAARPPRLVRQRPAPQQACRLLVLRSLPILFRWHRFIAYDGPVSLRRAFVPADWLRMLTQANISSATIEEHAMNRLCVARIR